MPRFLGIYVEAPTPGSSIPNIGIGTGPTKPAPPRMAGIETEPAGSGPIGQGTRASVPMGHLYGPKAPPTATQVGGTEEVPTTQSTVTQVRGWPANPVSNILPYPGSRESQRRTDGELQTGSSPPRILRQLYARIFGNIGESGHAFPLDGAFQFLPHVITPRSITRSGPLVRVSDDNAPVPAIYAGNPRILS